MQETTEKQPEVQYLLPPPNTKFFKANLHTHSDCSDGTWTVQEIKERYKSLGYSVIAFTDHEICLDHSDLNDSQFLALTSYEISVNNSQFTLPGEYTHTYHLNLISKDPHNVRQVYYHPDYLFANAVSLKDRVVHDGLRRRGYSVEEINAIIRAANENGYLVTYNHPKWSLQTSAEYLGLKGLWATEIINGASCLLGYEETQPHVFEELLRAGQSVFPMAADDCHNASQAGIGYAMIAAPELTYPAIINALEQGDFYASSGPNIFELYLKNGQLHVACSPCRKISMLTERRNAQVVYAQGDSLITEAVFDASLWFKGCDTEACKPYFRLSFVDEKGHMAYTRAYFWNEVQAHFSK